jgi:hypothetical protein
MPIGYVWSGKTKGNLSFNSILKLNEIKAAENLPTSVEVLVACGDGLAELANGEICDPGDPPDIQPDLGTSTCTDFNDVFGNPFASGTLECLSDCSGFATSSCFTCGNNYKERVEECDGSDFGGQTCISFGYAGGTLLCTADCRISTANCEAMEQPGGTPGSGSGGGSPGGTSGYSPGSEESASTKVVAMGKAYPHADVHILIDGRVVGIVTADAKADFYFETTDVTPGVASFGFWSEDPTGLKSTLLSLTFRVIYGAVTTITGVYLSPTIDVSKKSVRQGEEVKIYGHAAPTTEILVHINSEQEYIEQTNSKDTGEWELVFDTSPLEVDFHTAKALFQVNVEGNIIKSAFSRAVSFHVGKVGGEAACPGADLNADGRVNLTDFSILLYWWDTDNECADQDQSGNVDLVDFSIMMYYWTG